MLSTMIFKIGVKMLYSRHLINKLDCLSTHSQLSLLSAVPMSTTASMQLFTTTNKTKNMISQEQLPTLPVPSLASTIVNFLLFSKQLQSNNNEFMETLEVSREFVQSDEVKRLQKLLEERARRLPNWLTPWWINVAYLDARTPLPIVTSPGMIMPKLNFSGIDGQIEYCAKIIVAALTYHEMIISDNFPTENAGTDPLDMSQYEYMFGTTRIPCKGRDILQYGKDRSYWAKHIIVTRNGHTFKVAVYDENGKILPIEQLQSQLRQVVAESETNNKHSAVNVCSSDDRDVWASVYERIKESSLSSVKAVEDALFLFALDKSYIDPKLPASEQNMRQALHGNGTSQNTCNRWFDKALQFCINDDGYAAFTYEHTPAEGPPFAALLDFVQDKLVKNEFKTDPTSSICVEKPEKLLFNLTDKDYEIIKKSSKRINKAINNLEVKSLKFKHFGKNVPKAARMSPDSFVQIAMQLAFYNIHGTYAPTYETASCRRFQQGRTETIRLPNIESTAFVRAASSVNAEKSNNLKSLLMVAINAHKDYTRRAMLGQGMDRHLLGLKLMCAEEGSKLPELYLSKAYNKLTHFRLSSSQVSTRYELPMGYGPSADDCYGVCYNPRETEVTFTITAFNNCAETSAEKYAQELEAALLQMKDIVS